MRRGSLLLLFALSGAAALVYEVVWTRLLALQVGHGLAAASTVLAAFMGGLAIGAVAGGRIGQRIGPRAALSRLRPPRSRASPARRSVLPLLLGALQPVLAALYDNGAGGLGFGAVRLISSLVLLSVPAAAMGATFPLASRWVVRSAARVPVEAGRLYAANSLGAAAGAVLTGFVLLPSLGLTGATIMGVALNLIAAAGAWWLARSRVAGRPRPLPATGPGPAKGRSAVATGRPGSGRRPWASPGSLRWPCKLSGRGCWLRCSGLTTYAFSAVVAIFILGIAGGSALGAWLSRRSTRPVTALGSDGRGVRGPGAGAATPSTPCCWPSPRSWLSPDASFGQVVSREWAFTGAVLLPMAFTFGDGVPVRAVGGGPRRILDGGRPRGGVRGQHRRRDRRRAGRGIRPGAVARASSTRSG